MFLNPGYLLLNIFKIWFSFNSDIMKLFEHIPDPIPWIVSSSSEETIQVFIT